MEENKNMTYEETVVNEEFAEVKESKFKKVANVITDGAKKYGPKVVKGALVVVAVGAAIVIGKAMMNKDSDPVDEVGESDESEVSFIGTEE